MLPFERQGAFWLPDLPGRRVPGTLAFGADGVVLTLHEALREFTLPETGEVGLARSEQAVHT